MYRNLFIRDCVVLNTCSTLYELQFSSTSEVEELHLSEYTYNPKTSLERKSRFDLY